MNSNNQSNNNTHANFDNDYENNFGLIFNNIDRILLDTEFNNGTRNIEDIFDNDNDNIFLNMIMSSNINTILSNMFDLDTIYQEQLDSVIEESFETQPTLEKTDNLIDISSQKFDSLDDEIKNDNKNCSICLNDFEKEDDISVTKCSHVFHNNCIIEWGKYKATDETKTECPICRSIIE